MDIKFRFSDGQIITASSKKEAIKKYMIIASQEYGIVDADKKGEGQSQTEMPKSSSMLVIQKKDGSFMSTTSTRKYGHDNVRFTKDIDKADIFFYPARAKGVMNFLKKYNPKLELEVKKLKLSV